MSEDRIEDLPIFDDGHTDDDDTGDTGNGDTAGAWGSTVKRPHRPQDSADSHDEGHDEGPVNLADYSRSPARPRKPHRQTDPQRITTDGRAPQGTDQRPSWVERELTGIVHRDLDASTSQSLDWGLVAAFRAQTSARLSEWLRANPDATTPEREDRGRSIIGSILDDTAHKEMTGGTGTWSLDHQDRLADAIFDAVFRHGRLQSLIDDDRLENIEIRGDRPVLVEHADGILEERESVADTDQELIQTLQHIASRPDKEGKEREFSPTQPRLHMQLDGGARLAAAAWTTPYPIVVIRRHRLVHVGLTDLAELGTLSHLAVTFLAAAVKTDQSIVVTGSQGAGKTTMLRALCAEIPPEEHIGTFETEYELLLHEMPERHSRVDAFEARPGTGELTALGRRAGEITLTELLIDSFRFNQRRQIVGEVRGWEILTMIKAMQSGAGSMSTTHAKNGRAAVDKLVTCALEAGSHASERYAERALAAGIDLIVHVDMRDIPTEDGRLRRTRQVSEILAVEWTGDGVAYTDIFKRNQHGELIPGVLPDTYRDLARFGFDLPSYLAAGGEGRPS